MNVKNPSPLALQLALTAEKAHKMSRDKGFYDKERNDLELQMLMVTELAEAAEEVRMGTPPMYVEGEMQLIKIDSLITAPSGALLKPEGELIELADLAIRLLDYCAYKGYNLGNAIEIKMAYNATRGYRHGGKLY